MSLDHETFDLSELSAAAGVTPRTVRYYVQQGLLPSPGTRGPGTRYDRAHLDRLQLIRRLQRQHLPLAEIRRRLEALDDETVREALKEPMDETAGSSALDYVRDLLARQSARTLSEPPMMAASAPPPPVAPPAPSHEGPRRGSTLGAIFGRGAPAGPAHGAPAAHLAPAAQVIQQSRATRSTWDRVALAPDVELHVRRPLSREQNRLVERLIDAARNLFAEEP